VNKPVGVLLIVIFLFAAIYAGYRIGLSYKDNSEISANNEITTTVNGSAGDSQESSDLQEGEVVYHYDMSVEVISQYIHGRVFQAGSYRLASAWGRLLYFTPLLSICQGF